MGKRSRETVPDASEAETADLYELYQQSVQDPPTEVAFFHRVYRKVFGRAPRALREDFCGTFAICCDWVRRGAGRRAIGVDLDPEPLAWGREHNLARLAPELHERVRIVQTDARAVLEEKVDVVAAENFSWFIFKERADVLAYFRSAYHNLDREGVFVLDLMGGADAFREAHEQERDCGGFTYVWDHHRFDPITHHTTCYIHFRFEDGSARERAFRYDWRLWTLPETRAILAEAGFDRTHVYWEDTDRKTNEGTGTFRERRHAEADPSWVAYVVAVKGEGSS